MIPTPCRCSHLHLIGVYILRPYNFYLNPVVEEKLDVERIFSYQSGGEFHVLSMYRAKTNSKQPLSFSWVIGSEWKRLSSKESRIYQGMKRHQQGI